MSTFISAARKMGLWYGLIVAATLLLVPVVASATTIGNTITVTNDATISGNVTTTNATSSGYMDIGGKLANSNSSYGNGDLNVGNRLAVDGATYVSSTLDVTGNSRFYGTLTVDGASTLTGAVTAANSVSSTMVTSSRHLSVGTIIASLSQRWTNGDANISGQMLVEGSALVSSSLHVTGNSRFYGTLTADTSVSSTMVTSSRHLGVGSPASLSARWTNGDVNIGGQLLVDGNAFVSSSLQVTSVATLYGGFIAASSSIGTTLNVSGNLNASSTVFFGGNILPGTNNNADLGALGNAARSIFVSTSITIGGAASSSASSTAILGVMSALSASIDFVDMASSNVRCTDSSNTAGGDVTVTGTEMGNMVTVAPLTWDDAFTSGTLSAFVTAMNKIRIMYCGSANDVISQDRDPAAMRYRVTVWKF